MNLREEQCKKVCRILDDVLTNRPKERDSLIIAVQLAFESLSKTHWIPVTERLPNIREDVLISYYDEVMAGWLNDDGTWFAEGFGRLNMNDIVAWMPLSEPYKGATE